MRLQLTVNELSKVVNVPPRTIRYYNNIGIFKHSGVLDNGYRYYTIEKIEEIRLITYLRHLGVSLKEIGKHLDNRNIKDYEDILDKQLDKTRDKIVHFKNLEQRLEKRLAYHKYIRNLPEMHRPHIEKLPQRKILRLNKVTSNQYELEKAMLEFENLGDLPPSLIIGDQGFIVDLSLWDTRRPEDFAGMYMAADDPFIDNHVLMETLPEGEWLTIYLKGDHGDAVKWYGVLMDFAEVNNLTLDKYAFELTLIDHYISNDPNLYITQIQIPIIEKV